MKEKFMKFMNHQITVKDTIVCMLDAVIIASIIGGVFSLIQLRDHSDKLEKDDDIDKVIE